MVASLNLRELIHIANLRLCTRAQTEIRILVKRMCDELVEEDFYLEANQKIFRVLSDLNSEQRKIILEFLRIIMKVSDVRNANITF